MKPECSQAKESLSVVISFASSNRFGDAIELVEALKEQDDGTMDIIVVVGRFEYLFHKAKDALQMTSARVVFNAGKYGLSSQRNFALQYTKGSIIAFLDDDVIPSSRWTKAVHKTFHNKSIIGVTGPVDPLWYNGHKAIPDNINWVISCTTWTSFRDGQIIPYAYGGNMAFRRWVFDSGLRFEESIGLGTSRFVIGADTEFSLRAREVSGGKIVWNQEARVLHKIRPYRTSMEYLTRRSISVGVAQNIIRVTTVEINRNARSTGVRALLVSPSKLFAPSGGLNDAAQGLRNVIRVFVIIASLGVGYLYGGLFYKQTSRGTHRIAYSKSPMKEGLST